MENKIEFTQNSVSQIKSENTSAFGPKSVQIRYNLKEQLDHLIGKPDFSKKLNEVNLIIGIIVSVILLVYFIT
ncbi:MAG TPA: hypothetical protein VLN45_07215 [Ignavibacteriaceae bacterium]|nr:hypothetical protein [Ignavibacteriaceae bacterium]